MRWGWRAGGRWQGEGRARFMRTELSPEYLLTVMVLGDDGRSVSEAEE